MCTELWHPLCLYFRCISSIQRNPSCMRHFSNYICRCIYNVAKHTALLSAARTNSCELWTFINFHCLKVGIFIGINYVLLLLLLFFFQFVKEAEDALKYYKGYKGSSNEEQMAMVKEFEKLKAIVEEEKHKPKLRLSDFCTYIFEWLAVSGWE